MTQFLLKLRETCCAKVSDLIQQIDATSKLILTLTYEPIGGGAGMDDEAAMLAELEREINASLPNPRAKAEELRAKISELT